MRVILTIIAVSCVLAFSSPSLAASDEELGHLGDKMSGAFRCATYAGMSDDYKEQKRLFQKAAISPWRISGRSISERYQQTLWSVRCGKTSRQRRTMEFGNIRMDYRESDLCTGTQPKPKLNFVTAIATAL
jgi:hypothetical protein